MIAGSYPLVLQIFNHHAEISAKMGAPVAWLPFSPSAVVLETAGMIKGAAHPNACRLLLNFMISKPGQELMQKANYLPSRADVPALDPTLKPSGGLFTGQVLSPEVIAEGSEPLERTCSTRYSTNLERPQTAAGERWRPSK